MILMITIMVVIIRIKKAMRLTIMLAVFCSREVVMDPFV